MVDAQEVLCGPTRADDRVVALLGGVLEDRWRLFGVLLGLVLGLGRRLGLALGAGRRLGLALGVGRRLGLVPGVAAGGRLLVGRAGCSLVAGAHPEVVIDETCQLQLLRARELDVLREQPVHNAPGRHVS